MPQCLFLLREGPISSLDKMSTFLFVIDAKSSISRGKIKIVQFKKNINNLVYWEILYCSCRLFPQILERYPFSKFFHMG